MRIVVTGAGGFVGRRLVTMLDDYDVVAIDNNASAIPALNNVTRIVGDLCDRSVVEEAFSSGCDAVIHLATVPGGAAEENPELARRVNIDATMAIADKAASVANRPRFVFASSIAVYGDSLPASVDDSTPLAPKMLYGAHKAMMEQWLATMTRRGQVDAVSLRLPGVVARPRAPSGMKSAFISNVFHTLKAGEQFVLPVSAGATSWLASLPCVVANLEYALDVDLSAISTDRAVTLPAMRVRMSNLVAEIAEQTDCSAGLISYVPDTALEAAFGMYPRLTTRVADELGFGHDRNLASLVSRVLDGLSGNK